MGSIIFEILFAIRINLQIFAVSSIILLRAVCASAVISSASSRIIILKGILLSSPAYLENVFTLSLTMFIPRSSEALSSKVLSFQCSPRISWDRHRARVVFQKRLNAAYDLFLIYQFGYLVWTVFFYPH